jgi:hypothetical protein
LKLCFAGQLDEPVERNQLSHIKRDEVNFGAFWLKDDGLENPDLLPPNEIGAEIVENIEAAFDCFGKVAASLQGSGDRVPSRGVGARSARELRRDWPGCQAATAGSLTMGSSLKGAMVFRVM